MAAAITHERPARPGAPRAIMASIAVAWALAIAGQMGGTVVLLRHDALIQGSLPLVVALGVSLLAWQAMVVAMMIPSSLPLISLFARAARRQPRPRSAMAAFLGGYALAWTAFGAAAFLFDVAVHASVNAWPWLQRNDWLIGGGVLVVAGAFQFTPLKHACLDACRGPESFLLRHYDRGLRPALRLGLRHGVFCVGCCWALMLVMFAVGVANLVWMAALTAVMVHEKTRPAGRAAVPVTGIALLGLASLVLAWGAYAASAGCGGAGC
jgi:predicted metal-binding membrane protein